MRSLVPLLKLFAVKNSFEKKLLLLSLAGQLFFGLNFLDGGSTFKHVFRISGPAGSGKPDASILGESLGQEELNGTSSMRIGPANPPARL